MSHDVMQWEIQNITYQVFFYLKKNGPIIYQEFIFNYQFIGYNETIRKSQPLPQRATKVIPRKEIWSGESHGRGLKRDSRGTIIKCDLQNFDPDWNKPTLKRAF